MKQFVHPTNFIMSVSPFCFMGVTNYYDDDDIKTFTDVGILDLHLGRICSCRICREKIKLIVCSQNIYLVVSTLTYAN